MAVGHLHSPDAEPLIATERTCEARENVYQNALGYLLRVSWRATGSS